MNRYRYYFENLESKPIAIEAGNKVSSRYKLEEICSRPEYQQKGYILNNLVKETVETLVVGLSEKIIKDQLHIWDGVEWSPKTNSTS